MATHTILLTIVCWVATASGALAERLPCDALNIFVDTEDQLLRERVCNVARSALPKLANCHLRQHQTIFISFHAALSMSGNDCLGLYHSGNNHIDLLTPEAFHASHGDSEFCEEIPENVHFDSILVHELTHALLDQVPGGKANNLVDQEYIAYAMQLEMMCKPVRDRFISSIGLTAPIDVERINEFAILFSPSVFAASSWLHFSSLGHGCEFVGEIIKGEKTLWHEPY